MSAPQRSQTEAIRELLPWYATGALSRQDARAVELALTEDPELARHFDLIREEMAETIHRNELLGAPSARVFERLMTSIDSEPRVKKVAFHNPIAGIGEFLSGFSMRSLSWVATATAVLVVIQAGVIAELVSGGAENPISVRGIDLSRGSYVLIRFNGSATANEITRFLEANRLTVVSGPTSAATFQVKVADTQLSKNELDQRIRALQQASVVAAVMPVE